MLRLAVEAAEEQVGDRHEGRPGPAEASRPCEQESTDRAEQHVRNLHGCEHSQRRRHVQHAEQPPAWEVETGLRVDGDGKATRHIRRPRKKVSAFNRRSNECGRCRIGADEVPRERPMLEQLVPEHEQRQRREQSNRQNRRDARTAASVGSRPAVLTRARREGRHAVAAWPEARRASPSSTQRCVGGAPESWMVSVARGRPQDARHARYRALPASYPSVGRPTRGVRYRPQLS